MAVKRIVFDPDAQLLKAVDWEGMGAVKYAVEFTASGTWPKPAGVEIFGFVLVGAGGAGGGSNNASYGGFGGGGGEVKAGVVKCASAAADIAITIPSAATGGSGAAAGANGSSASIGSYVTALGGTGGQYGRSDATIALAPFGGGPWMIPENSTTAWKILPIGTAGGNGGWYVSALSLPAGCAAGGIAGAMNAYAGLTQGFPGGGSFSAGADGVTSGSNGNSASGYGGGGCGAGAGIGKVGGNGAPGYALIYYFI